MDDPLDERLNKLVELRNGGILSEAEFRKARKRLLEAAAGTGDGTAPTRRSVLHSYWPAFVGLAILLLLVIGLVVYGRISSRSDGVEIDIGGANGSAAVLDSDPDIAERCGAADMRGQITQMVFDRAVRLHGGDPAPLNSLRRAVGVRLEGAVFRSAETETDRAHCSARLLLDVPPSAREAFDGATTLEADIEYGVFGSVSGGISIIELDGVDTLVQRLADGASVARGRQLATAKTFNPSFDCTAARSDVEQMICADEDLSRLDRAISSRYVEYRQSLDPDGARALSASQRDFLERRGQCLDVACIRDLYVAQGRYLDRLTQVQEGMPN